MPLEFDLAERADDEALRDLLRRTPMPGDVALAFRREPSFFVAARAGNLETQTLVCRDEAGEVVGLGERGMRRAYVDGRPTALGYLSNLRGAVEWRKGLALARGYRYLRALHADGKAPFYVTTILEENADAVAVLTSGRGSLPTYEHVATLFTYLLPLRRRRRRVSATFVERVAADGLGDAVACLDAWNSRHQFAPVYERDDLAGRTGLLPHFSSENLYVARDAARVVGTLGVWDQSSFKQTVVSSYARRVAHTRPLLNAYAALRGVPGLPPAGGQLRLLYGAFLSAADDDPATAEALVERAVADWSGRGFSYLVVGVAEGRPLSVVLERHAARRLGSHVYAVYWPEDDVPAFERARPVHLEVATL